MSRSKKVEKVAETPEQVRARQVAEHVRALQETAALDVEGSARAQLEGYCGAAERARAQFAAVAANNAEHAVEWEAERAVEAQTVEVLARSVLSPADRGHDLLECLKDAVDRATEDLMGCSFGARSTSALSNGVRDVKGRATARFVREVRDHLRAAIRRVEARARLAEMVGEEGCPCEPDVVAAGHDEGCMFHSPAANEGKA